jgi:hypothetical protein
VWCFIPTDTTAKEQAEGIAASAAPVADSDDADQSPSDSVLAADNTDPATGNTPESGEPTTDSGASQGNSTPSNSAKKDKYNTAPVPEGKPQPNEPQEININKKKEYTCTFYIECGKILENMDKLNPAKAGIVPPNGVIYAKKQVVFYEGESVGDLLKRETRSNGIHMEFNEVPAYNSAYIEGIANLYEFDCGALSGWMYSVNGWFPNYGISRYQLNQGDNVELRYTCDLGRDLGATM